MVQLDQIRPRWRVIWSKGCNLDMDKVQLVKDEVKYATWAAQIEDCQNSGLSIQQWCTQNGISKKTYYYRLRRVRERTCSQIAFPIGSIERPVDRMEPQVSVGAVRLHTGTMTVEIADGTSAQTIEAVIRALSC